MSQVRLAHKQQLIIVQHDGNFCSEAAFSTLQQAINAARDSEGQAAVGLATLLGFDDACAELQVGFLALLLRPRRTSMHGS